MVDSGRGRALDMLSQIVFVIPEYLKQLRSKSEQMLRCSNTYFPV